MMQAPNPATACARAIVDELARSGVRDVVLAPGSRSAALAFAFHDHGSMRVHVQIDERSAGFVALGIARATGRPAVVVTTSGSAVAHLHPAVVEADLDRVPMLALTADRPPELRHTGSNQTIDQAGLFGRAARWSVDLPALEDRPDAVALWRSTACQALARARGAGGAPGPVQLNVAFREPTVPASDDGRSPVAEFSHDVAGRADGGPWTRVETPSTVASGATLEGLAQRIADEARGVIVVGQTTASAPAVHELARVTGWPIVSEPCGRIRSGPNAVAHGHHLLGNETFRATHRPGMAVRLGRCTLSSPVESALDGVVQVLIDPDASWSDPRRTLAEIVVADLDEACGVLADRLSSDGRSRDDEWLRAWRRADGVADSAIGEALEGVDAPCEPRVARDLVECVPDGTRLVAASSMPIRDVDRHAAPRSGVTFLSNRGASGIDGAVSTTLGVATGAPGPVVGLVGDLAFLHDSNGFLLSPAEPLGPVVFVVVDNDGGGLFSFLPQARFEPAFERVFATPHGRDLEHLGRLHGLAWFELSRAGDLGHVVTGALEGDRIAVVHVRTDRADNVAIHRSVDAAVDVALDGLLNTGGG